MGFFSRKKEEDNNLNSRLPELPDVRLPELPEDSNATDIQPLPKFPESSTGNSFGLQAIKSNVGFRSKVQEQNEEEIKEGTEKTTMEISDLDNYKPTEISKRYSSAPMERNYSSDKEPIFIKLDKFKEAVEKFDEIKDKIQDIDDSIKQIREIKEKEEQELKLWEEEVQAIKEKAANIDSSLFSKI